MKSIKIMAILLIALLNVPFAASAMSHQDHGSHDNEKAAETGHHDDHGSHNEQTDMAAEDSMMIVGSMVSKGVKGMAHLKDVSTKMAEMGMKTTHHFMIAFIDEATGNQIDAGAVALKITNPDAKVGETIELMGMDGHFGADVTLDMPGEYHFRLGTKLADGVKRKYHFHQVVE